ncbi:hypothetical protein ACJX0J_042217, partial [Zea mays]
KVAIAYDCKVLETLARIMFQLEFALANTTIVDESGKQHFIDASVAYKHVVLNGIEYLARFGYSKEQ